MPLETPETETPSRQWLPSAHDVDEKQLFEKNPEEISRIESFIDNIRGNYDSYA